MSKHGIKARVVTTGKHDKVHTPERPHVVSNAFAGFTCSNTCALLKYQKVPDSAEVLLARMPLPNYVVRHELGKQPVTIYGMLP
jgi:hypothetical protein